MKDCYLFDKNCFLKNNRYQNTNAEAVVDTCGMTELHLVAFRNDAKVAESLLAEGANVNCKNKCGQTPLRIATQKGNMEVAEVLLAWGANVNIPDLRGSSPLQAAMDSNDEEMTDLLIATCLGG